jgi:hypothetical protein
MAPPFIGCTTQLSGMPHASFRGPVHKQQEGSCTSSTYHGQPTDWTIRYYRL